jgi:hypothetical protein
MAKLFCVCEANRQSLRPDRARPLTNVAHIAFPSGLPLRKSKSFQGPLKFAIQGASVCQLGKGAVTSKFLAHFTHHNSFSQTFLAE